MPAIMIRIARYFLLCCFGWGVFCFLGGCQQATPMGELGRVAVVRSTVVGGQNIQPDMSYWGNFMTQFIAQLDNTIPTELHSALLFHQHAVFQQLPLDTLPDTTLVVHPFRPINISDPFYAQFLSETLSVDAVSGVTIDVDIIPRSNSFFSKPKEQLIVSHISVLVVDKKGHQYVVNGKGESRPFPIEGKDVSLIPYLTHSLEMATLSVRQQITSKI